MYVAGSSNVPATYEMPRSKSDQTEGSMGFRRENCATAARMSPRKVSSAFSRRATPTTAKAPGRPRPTARL